jgi:N-acylglucosamine-6-phosphate 2-epimerase
MNIGRASVTGKSMNDFLDKIKGGLIVSCYTAEEQNPQFNFSEAMIALANSVEAGGAAAIRVNVKWVPLFKHHTKLPIMGIKKVYKDQEMRISPTLKEIEEIAQSGADAVAIDATHRKRFDELTLEQFIKKIKDLFNILVLGDISVVEEGINAARWGVDGVSTTISGYTPYSPQFGKLGDIPPKEADYQLIRDLCQAIDIPVICEGRINTPEKAAKAIECGAHAVVVGTAITNPQKITELFVAKIKGLY